MQAQTTCPPEPDCFQDVFQPGPPIIVPMNALAGIPCDYEVEWCYRLACGTQFDMVITKIIIDMSSCQGINNLDFEELKKDVARKVATDYSHLIGREIPPCDESNILIWRLAISTCLMWTEIENIDGNRYVEIVNCGEGQCWKAYRLCWETFEGQQSLKVESTGNSNALFNTCLNAPGTIQATNASNQWELMLFWRYRCIYYCD